MDRHRCRLAFLTPIDALPFFYKRPELVHLTFLQVIVLDQLFADLLTVYCCLIQNPLAGLAVDIEDARGRTNPIPFAQSFQHAIDRCIVRVKPGENRRAPLAELPVTFWTTIACPTTRSVVMTDS